MKARVTVNVDGCEAASHEFDADPVYSRENKPGGFNRLRLVFEKNMDRIEMYGGGTGRGGDRGMILRVDRTEDEESNKIVIFGTTPNGTDKGKVLFGGTPNGTNGGKMSRADRTEIVVDITGDADSV